MDEIPSTPEAMIFYLKALRKKRKNWISKIEFLRTEREDECENYVYYMMGIGKENPSSGLQLMAVGNFMNMTFRSRNSNENGNLNSCF